MRIKITKFNAHPLLYVGAAYLYGETKRNVFIITHVDHINKETRYKYGSLAERYPHDLAEGSEKNSMYREIKQRVAQGEYIKSKRYDCMDVTKI